MHTDSTATLVDRLAGYDRLVEVGVGNRTDVAADLTERGRSVIATDIHDRSTPSGVRFVRDDVTDPEVAVYRKAEAVYSLNCPPELQRPLIDVAADADADCFFTTLGSDPAVIDATPETLADETLFGAHT